MVCEYRYGPEAMEYLKKMPDISYSEWRNFVREKFRKKNGEELAHAGKVAYYAWRNLGRDLTLSLEEKNDVSFEFEAPQFEDLEQIDETSAEEAKKIGEEVYGKAPKEVMQFNTSRKPFLMVFEEDYHAPRMVIVKKSGLFSREEMLASKIYRYLGARVFDITKENGRLFIEWLDGVDCHAMERISTEKVAFNFVYYLGKAAADAHCIGLGDRFHNERANLSILKSEIVEEFRDDVFNPIYNIDYEFAFLRERLRRTPEEDLITVWMTFKKIGLENIADEITESQLEHLIAKYIEGFHKRYREIQESYQINKGKVDELLRTYDEEVLHLCKTRFETNVDELVERLEEILASTFFD